MNSDFARWLLGIDLIPKGTEELRLAWERPWAAWVWMLLILGAVALAAWSYRRLSGGRLARGGMTALRIALLLVVLVVVSGPMLEHRRETVEQDWVLVLTDRSRSMEIADAGDASARSSRDEQLKSTLEGQAAMWNRLAETRHVVWLGFHVGAFNLAQREKDPAAPVDPSAPETLAVDLGAPGGERTNLGTAIDQALQQAAARPLSGVVLLTDGRTTDPPDRAMIRRLQAAAVPLFVVPLGSDEPIGDVAIRRVESPRRAFVRDKVPVVIEFDRAGTGGAEAPITVKLVDTVTGEVLDEAEALAGDEAGRVTLTAQPQLAGEAAWKIVIETDRPDLVPENNARPLNIDLVDRPLRVLYIEGYPRWEYRYLKNLLVREASIDSSVMLLSADRDFAQEGNQPITRLPRSPEELAQFDVIVLGDVPASFFSSDQLAMMQAQVADRGTGLLWIGGERYTPRSFAGTTLGDLIPMRGPLNLPAIDRPVTMQPTKLAERLGVMRVVTGDELGWPNELIDPSVGWSQLYYAQRIEPGRLKPTAEALAETTDPFNGAPLPLVVHMRYGAGQSIYVATDEIWRWRYGRGEMLPEQFWIQMLRMLGRESLITSGAQATLDVRPRRVELGQPVLVDLRFMDARLSDERRTGVSAVLETMNGERVADLELRRSDGGPERFATTWISSATGQLRVRLDEPDLADLELDAPLEVFAPEDEMRRPETDHPLLAELATSTGGHVLAPAELTRLEQLLPNRSVRTINPLTERIWDTPLFFGLIVLLITLEWIGRKVIRLA